MKVTSTRSRSRVLKLQLFAAASLTMLIAGCGDSDGDGGDSGNTNVAGQSVLVNYNEHDFAHSPDLRANPDDIVTLQLEDTAGSYAGALDTGDSMGVDVVPYTFLETAERTFCWQLASDESANVSGSVLRLVDDLTGDLVLEVVEGGECVTQTIPAGQYSAFFHHGSNAEQERDLIFIVPLSGASTLTSEGSGAGPDENPPPPETPHCEFAVLTSPDFVPPFLPAGLMRRQVLEGLSFQYVPEGGCTDVSLIRDARRMPFNDVYTITLLPGFTARVYADLYYRGPRKTLSGSGIVLSFAGPGSMVMLRGEPDQNRDWLIFTNGCDRCNLSGVNLDGVDLSRAWLRQTDLSHASLKGANLTNAYTLETVFKSAHLSGANLSGANLTGATFDTAGTIEGSEQLYSAADLSDANLTSALLTQATLRGATLTRATLATVNAEGADFTRVSAVEAKFQDANLKSAVLTNATLTRASFDRAMLQGAHLQGASLGEARLPEANLTGAFLNRERGLNGAFLDKAYLYNAKLDNADLTDASLREARFYGPAASAGGATFNGARLDRAVLFGVNFADASLARAVLDNATCVNCKFNGAKLGATASQAAASFDTTDVRGAEFTNATIDGCRFSDARVSFADTTGTYRYDAEGHVSYAAPFGVSRMGPVTTSESVLCPNGSLGPCDTREKLTGRQPTPTATLRPPTATPAGGCTPNIPLGTFCPRTATPTPVP